MTRYTWSAKHGKNPDDRHGQHGHPGEGRWMKLRRSLYARPEIAEYSTAPQGSTRSTRGRAGIMMPNAYGVRTCQQSASNDALQCRGTHQVASTPYAP